MKKRVNKMAGKSLADKLASLANPEPVFHDPEAEDDVTAAKVAAWVRIYREEENSIEYYSPEFYSGQ